MNGRPDTKGSAPPESIAGMFRRYAPVVPAIALVSSLKLWLDWLGEPTPFLLYFGAIMLAAWVGGWGPGLLATALSSLIALRFFLPPARSLGSSNPEVILQVGVFAVEGILITALCATVSRSRAKLEERVLERTADLERANQALKTASEEINDLYDNAPCGYHSLDGDGRFTRINSTELAWLGCTAEEIVGKVRFTDLLTPSSVLTFAENFPRYKQQGWIRDLEFEILRKDRTTFWGLLSSTAVVGDAGEFVRSRSTMVDITARKRTEEALARFESIVQTSDDAIIGKTLEGMIASWNPGAERLYGYTVEEAVGSPISMLAPSDRPDEVPRVLERIRRGERVEHYETIRQRKNGTRLHVSLTISPIYNSAGEITGASTIARNITDRVSAQEAIARYSAQLERSNQELQQFASAASHDLQEPLRKISAYGELLKAEYYQALEEEGRDYVDLMQSAAARMQSLIDGLLAIARVTTRESRFTPVNLNDLVRDVLADLELRIQEVGGRVDVEDLPGIHGDPTQIRQLFQNLISNGLKFTAPDSPPVVRIYSEEAPEAEPADRRAHRAGFHRIVVQDNGIGFDLKYTDRIFQPFERLHGRGTYEGTGIGLAICRRIVERHGGSITAESRPGEGARFILTLPPPSDHETQQ